MLEEGYKAGSRRKGDLEQPVRAVRKGKVYAVLGNNGVGKSTLSYVLMGLESHRDYDGSIVLDGDRINVCRCPKGQKRYYAGWQEPARFTGLTVKEYLTLGGKMKLSSEELLEISAVVGLNGDYLDRFVDDTLSGGERKRAELASISIVNPHVVILTNRIPV